jgi:hypothetical protein
VPSSADVHISGRPPLAGTLQPLEAPLIEARDVAASAAGADEQRHQDLGCECRRFGSPCPAVAIAPLRQLDRQCTLVRQETASLAIGRKAGPPSAKRETRKERAAGLRRDAL